MSKIITFERAAELVRDGATVACGSMGLSCWPDEIAEAIAARFTATGHPRDLYLRQGAATGDWKERGTTRLGIEGLVTRWSGAHIGSSAGMAKLCAENKIQAHCLPQGVILHLWREIAAHRPGLITKVGLGTFVDPRVEGGRMNGATTEDIVRLVEFDGEEWLYYKSFPIDVAILRGTTADENGNITLDNEGFLGELLPIAQATRNTGGIVIVQVEYLARAGSLHPKRVAVPGVLVDYVVVATKKEACWQTEGLYFDPAFSGDVKIPTASVPALPLDERKIISRRAAMELKADTVINLGYGMPADVAAVAAEEGVSHRMTLTTEAGGFGGVPASPPNFGVSYNAEALVYHHEMFDFYDGGGIDVAYLGLAQADRDGNVNVSKFGRPNGCGGFINITQNAKKVVYTGTFTAGGLKVAVEGGKLAIVREGRNRKFLKHVEQITFSGKYAASVGQPVVYVTERAVFTLKDGEMTLIEIAPGIDLEKDVLGLMGFRPRIAPDLKTMPAGIFAPAWGGLATAMGLEAP